MTRKHLLRNAVLLLLWLLIAGSSLLACAQPTLGPTPTLDGPLGPQPPSPTPIPPAEIVASPPDRPAPRPDQGQAEVRTLTILYTNDTRGYLDPCG